MPPDQWPVEWVSFPFIFTDFCVSCFIDFFQDRKPLRARSEDRQQDNKRQWRCNDDDDNNNIIFVRGIQINISVRGSEKVVFVCISPVFVTKVSEFLVSGWMTIVVCFDSGPESWVCFASRWFPWGDGQLYIVVAGWKGRTLPTDTTRPLAQQLHHGHVFVSVPRLLFQLVLWSETSSGFWFFVRWSFGNPAKELQNWFRWRLSHLWQVGNPNKKHEQSNKLRNTKHVPSWL